MPPGTCEYVGVTDCAILTNLKTLIVFVNTNVLLSVTEIRVLNSEWWNPFYRLHGVNERVVTGYAAYVNRLWSERINYMDQYPDITPQRIDEPFISMSMSALEPGTNLQYLNEDYKLSITSPMFYFA